MHPVRNNLRYIGASDLCKAYDRIHGRLAGEALNRLGVPAALARTWEKAWTQQSRFFQFGEQITLALPFLRNGKLKSRCWVLTKTNSKVSSQQWEKFLTVEP